MRWLRALIHRLIHKINSPYIYWYNLLITRYFLFVFLRKTSYDYFLGNWLSCYKLLKVLTPQPINFLNLKFRRDNVQLDLIRLFYLSSQMAQIKVFSLTIIRGDCSLSSRQYFFHQRRKLKYSIAAKNAKKVKNG